MNRITVEQAAKITGSSKRGVERAITILKKLEKRPRVAFIEYWIWEGYLTTSFAETLLKNHTDDYILKFKRLVEKSAETENRQLAD